MKIESVCIWLLFIFMMATIPGLIFNHRRLDHIEVMKCMELGGNLEYGGCVLMPVPEEKKK